MKIGRTAAFATLAATVIAGATAAIYLHLPVAMVARPAATAAAAIPPASRALPVSPAASASAGLQPATSVAELTRLAIKSFTSTDADVREQAASVLLPSLAQRDPAAAARVADLLADPGMRTRMLGVVAQAWTDQNRIHALAWAQGLSDANDREIVLAQIYSQIARRDPAGAVSLRQQFSADYPEDPELYNLAQVWAESDLHAVLGWTDSLAPGPPRDQLVARVAFIQSRSDPGAAAQWVTERIPPGEARSEALISVVHQWALRDFDAASAWVDLIPERLLQERAAEELEAARRARP